MNFGYLPKSNIETGNLRTEEQLINAIKSLQKMGNIPETGFIDNETRDLMRRPRCGQPDKKESNDFTANNEQRRRKRYLVNGAKWTRTHLSWR